MSDKWCCVQFRALWPELVDLKKKELRKLERKGIPKSTFANVYAVLEAPLVVCPVCGGGETNKPASTQVPEKQEQTVKPKEPEAEEVYIKCVGCGGTGWYKAKPETNRKCSRCKGTAKLKLPIDCPFCKGTGKMGGNPNNTALCPKCHGTEELSVDNVNTSWIIGEVEKLQRAQSKHQQKQREKKT